MAYIHQVQAKVLDIEKDAKIGFAASADRDNEIQYKVENLEMYLAKKSDQIKSLEKAFERV
jgi:hypothetical protein